MTQPVAEELAPAVEIEVSRDANLGHEPLAVGIQAEVAVVKPTTGQIVWIVLGTCDRGAAKETRKGAAAT